MNHLPIMLLAAALAHINECPPPPERVTLWALATNVYAYLDTTIEVCGRFQGNYDPYPSERIMYASSMGNPYWFLVDSTGVDLPAEGSDGCVVGVVKRRDGLTPEEARARGIHSSYTADGLQNHDFVLFPTPSRQR